MDPFGSLAPMLPEMQPASDPQRDAIIAALRQRNRIAQGPHETLGKIGEGVIQGYRDYFDPFIKDDSGRYYADQPMIPNSGGKVPEVRKDYLNDVIGALDIGSNLIGAPGAAGVAGAGVKAIFAGVGAKTANLAKLAQAEKMVAKGVSREQIWNETGWFKGADEKWRFEIPDDNLSVRKGYGAGIEFGAGESWGRHAPKIEHPDLTAAYPGKMDYLAHDVKIQRGAEPSGRFMPEGAGRNEEYYYSDKPVLPTLFVEAPTARQARSISSHELQHRVQGEERFAPGANPQMYHNELWGETHDRNKLAEMMHDMYRRTAGEVEARNVQARLNMTPEQRRATAPWVTQDVPDAEQVIRAFGSWAP